MKFKLLVRIVEDLLQGSSGDAPRADMYLPERVLSMGIVLLVIAIVLAIRLIFDFQLIFLALAIAAAGFGAAAILCWRNQTIRIVDEDSFIYTTFLGNSRRYRFSQITGLIKNRDSFTLLLGNEKVHMEASAVMSQALTDHIQEAIEKAVQSQKSV